MIQITPIRYWRTQGEDYDFNHTARPIVASALTCAGCFSADAPPPRDYAKETKDTLQAQIDLAPQLYATEAKYQPKYADLALKNLNTILQGQPGEGGTPGLYALMQQQNSAQRAADVGDVATLGPEARAAMLAANPDQAALLERLNQQALTGLDAGTSMTAEEARQVQQASRAAFAARGTSGTNQSIADELLQQFNMGQQLLRQRQGFAGNVLGYNQAVVGDPFQQILGRPSNAAAQGQGLMGQAGPSIFNPESGYAGNLYNANQQMAAMFAEPSTISKIGAVSNTVGSFIGSIAGGVACWAAREVFGEQDVRWLQFRHWLLTKASARLREWYLANGEAWAERLHNNPTAKAVVRRWMERRIQ